MAKLKLERLYELSRISQINGAKDGTPLWIQSDPGIGKTASVQAYCDSINNHCEVIILGRIPSIDIGGMYVPNMATGELDHFISRKLLGEIKGAEGKDGICIFFDELPNTTEEQQTAIQSLVQDRVLEGRKIPDNVWFIFAGNFTGSNCGANEVVLSLQDRLAPVLILSDHSTTSPSEKSVPGTYISVQRDIFPEWMNLAVDEWKLHDWVTGYNQYMKGEAFHSFDPGVSGAQPSPRKWTKLSNLLKIPGIDGQELQLLGQAEIGASQWAEFWGWVQLGQKVPVYEDVCNDPDDCPRPPDEKPDHQYAVIMNIAKGVKDAGDLITKEEVDSVLTYLRRLPETFAAYGWKVCKKNNDDFAQRSSSVAVFTQEYGESIR
tara:strand:- start:17416 stop:18546 length:1131 start_codon:yes stop_codon:yes gene_type:complete